MMNKMSQIEKNMLEFQRKELERLKNSGQLEQIERLHKAINPALLKQLAEIKKPVNITPIDLENMRPTDKRIRKAEEVLYNYTFQNKNAAPNDILSDEKYILQSIKQKHFDIIVDLNPVFHLGITRLISLLSSDLKIGFTSPFSDKFYNIQLDISKSGIMEKGFKQINLILAQ